MQKRRIPSNPGLMILSFVLALVLWLVVANIENPVTTKVFRDVEVTITNENAIKEINKVYEVSSGDKATFAVKGRRSVLDNLTAKDFKVVADLSHMSEVYSVPVQVTPKSDNLDIEVYKNDNTMIVSLENEKSENLPITITTSGEVANGYALGDKTATPNIVTVTGPESLIRKTKEARVTVKVDGATSDIEHTCKIEYYDGNGELLESPRLSADVKNVAVTVQVLKTKSVPVHITPTGTPAAGYNWEDLTYEPKSVDVAGTDEVLAQISSIEIRDVDLTGLSENQEYTFKVCDYVPKEAVLINPDQQIMVTVTIDKFIKREIKLTKDVIDFAGVQAKYDYSLADDTSIIVELKGYQKDLNNLSASDLKAMIDVSKLSAGTHLCDITVVTDEHTTAQVMGKAKVTVKKAKN